ncbi:LAMI_0H15258g1_1 [Lachancea mirantina]|uniref:LAMI_0H15258g1_1 n=1 Tax=Lachancea mirantina TaxID=1230905 RepID=A0A1G4KIE9_9SACH|nr:LAMI_0H15258g1_1 [Lachancea mirantina]
MSARELIKRAGNQATTVNPAYGVEYAMSTRGSDWLWAVFSIFAALTVVYSIVLIHAERVGTDIKRIAVVGPLAISLVLAFSYYTMASNLGWTAIQAEFNRHSSEFQDTIPGFRQIFYAKYVAWFLTWPILLYLLELTATITTSFALTSGVATKVTTTRSWSFSYVAHTLSVEIGASLIFVIALLVGSLIHSTYKWGYWTFAAFAQLLVTFVLFRHYVRDLLVALLDLTLLVVIEILILLYLVAWALSDGANVISVDGGHVFFGVLDLCLFAILPAILYLGIKSPGRVRPFSFWKIRHHTQYDLEKGEAALAANAATNSEDIAPAAVVTAEPVVTEGGVHDQPIVA